MVVSLVALLAGLIFGTGVLIFRHFKADASATSRLYSGVFGGLNNPRPGAEAEALLDQAEVVFAARAHVGRMVSVLTARAFLLFRSGDVQGSRRVFEAVLDATSKADRGAHLDALSNLMWVRVELREADSGVEREVQRLMDENSAMGRTVQVARARWMMARIKVVLGRYDEAVELFGRAANDIADGDASIRIGLDAAEALLLGGRLSESQKLARELASTGVALDQREPTRRRTLTAQAYLMEAAHRQA